MMKNIIKTFFLFIVSLVVFVSSARATVIVYTDQDAWEAAVLMFQHYHLLDFDGLPTGNLSIGNNWQYGDQYSINISGSDPGINAIDDSFTPDPYSDNLSPNGSTYYLGQVASPITVPSLFSPDEETLAFGANWVTSGLLTMEVAGSSILFSDHLPTGAGFLGIISDQIFKEVIFSGDAVFGMDDARIAGVPIPATIWLFGSGLLGLIGISRRHLN